MRKAAFWAALLVAPHVGAEDTTLEGLAQRAASGDSEASQALRNAGPAGLVALLQSQPRLLSRVRAGERSDAGERLRRAIDVVSGQRDGHASGLYWYDDIARARAAARELDRPILSLRMLGRLDEEMSCANSRFFRLVLYPDAEVRQILASQFVLHWSSEREHAPRVTIDMGDGRVLERTITGNSIHYVLDSAGRPVDAIPGLYTPQGFANALREAQGRHQRCGGNRACVRREHTQALARLETRWNGMRRPGAPTFAQLRGPQGGGAAIPAREALPVAITKSFVEMPVLEMIQGAGANNSEPQWEEWSSLPAVRFGAPARALLRLKSGRVDTQSMEARFANLIGTDELQNEFGLRRQIHERFGGRDESFSALNQWVYASIFLTPASDPWLGLANEDVFDGIERLR